MTEIIHTDKIDETSAKIIECSIINLIKLKGKVILAIPGGTSVHGIFKLLKEQDIDWSKVHIFMVDERKAPLTDDESNFKLANDTFISQLKIPKENVHPLTNIKEYESELQKHGGKFDIVLLSSGEDGHIAALYPDHHSIKDESDFFIEMNDSPKPPKDRMSSSKNLLLKSKIAILVFKGEKKVNALKKFLDESLNYTQCPAKLVNSIPESHVITDIQVI